MYSNEEYLDNIFSSAYIHVNDNNERKTKLFKDSINNRPDNLVNRIRNLKNDKKLKRKKIKKDNLNYNINNTINTNDTSTPIYNIDNNYLNKSNPSNMDKNYININETKNIENNENDQSFRLLTNSYNDNNFKTKVTMKRSISLTEFGRSSFNDITVSDFPRWITLQSNYLQQIITLTKKISIDIGGGLIYKHQLLMLLVAHRNIIVRMVDIYQQAEAVAGEKNILKATNTLISIRTSLNQIATCLDFLHNDPFLHWLGVDPKLNPLLIKKRINGSQAKCPGLDHIDLAKELIVNDYDEKVLIDANEVLWDIYYFEHHHTNSKTVKFDEQFNHHHVRNKYSNKDNYVNKPLKENWDHWRWAYIASRKLKEYHLSRCLLIKRKIFQSFERYYWVNNRIKEMNKRRDKRKLVLMIMYWQQYTSWCHSYNNLYKRSMNTIKRTCLHKMHDYIKENHDTRVWKKSINRMLMKKYFKDLKTFTKLSKHELKTRLQRGSVLSFDDKHLMRYTFDRWSKRIKIADKLYGLDELMLYNDTKKAFITWKINTNIGRSIVLTAVKEIIKVKAIDLHDYTKEQAKNLYEYTKVKAKKGYNHAKAHAHAKIRHGHKILNKKLQQFSRKLKEKIEDTYNNHFNSTNVRKKLFTLTDIVVDDDDINDTDNNNNNNNNVSIDAKNDNNSNSVELSEEVKLKNETLRKSRILKSIKHARSQVKRSEGAVSGKDTSIIINNNNANAISITNNDDSNNVVLSNDSNNIDIPVNVTDNNNNNNTNTSNGIEKTGSNFNNNENTDDINVINIININSNEKTNTNIETSINNDVNDSNDNVTNI